MIQVLDSHSSDCAPPLLRLAIVKRLSICRATHIAAFETSISDFKVRLFAANRLWPRLGGKYSSTWTNSSNGNGVLLSVLRREMGFREDALFGRDNCEKYRVRLAGCRC